MSCCFLVGATVSKYWWEAHSLLTENELGGELSSKVVTTWAVTARNTGLSKQFLPIGKNAADSSLCRTSKQ
jgi:hypothetical protein